MKKNKKFVIISGLSGSGKSTAIKIFEDIGFYCVDNLPISFLPKFVELCRSSGEGINHVAMGVDIREREFLKEFPRIFRKLRQELPMELIFLEASKKVMVRRFSETRRRHPLADEGALTEIIEREIKTMGSIREMADKIIDTSEMTIHDLKAMLTKMYLGSDENAGITISLISFGYKYGLPFEADIILDARFLPNPFFNDELRPHTGKSSKVKQFIFSFPETKLFLKKVEDLLEYLIPRYVAEGKAHLTIGIGCTGGMHRSVSLIEELQRKVSALGYPVLVNHRDIKED